MSRAQPSLDDWRFPAAEEPEPEPADDDAVQDCGHLIEYEIAGACLRCEDPTPDGPADGLEQAVEGRSAGRATKNRQQGDR